MGPVGALLGQEVMALGADMSSWAVDRMEGAPRGDSQGPGGTLGAPASTYWSQHEQSSFFGTFPHGFSQ